MKKDKLAKICGILSPVFLIVFAVKTIADYSAYSSTLNSAPFGIWVLVNAVYFILPAIVLFVLFILFKHKK